MLLHWMLPARALAARTAGGQWFAGQRSRSGVIQSLVALHCQAPRSAARGAL